MTAFAPSATALTTSPAAADPAVQQHLYLSADGCGDGGQRTDGGRSTVQVVAAVVGHRDRRGSGVNGPFGVVDAGDALDQERPAPQLP
jgi:hypothetical protein